ncbi:zinc ABC transporter substrate-binding protein [Microbacterium sp. zg.B48]|uniref:metal ABC transporter solute-binding protein, Zn/Mn family n=1 Tax=Microbacterium sp. zg.B48 TaxID=2969408 RepID=UPI00214B172F|nr:zinc ABC transporter substrate-binding protein [Microbacterium sp. zg.B48]MCR2762789.1 zinc ABC transporter substrate-binding protein [Microbacterium sp. zg.B48]
MPRRSHALALLALTVTGALALAGCASTGSAAEGEGRLRVVASTNVYAQLASEIGGDLVDATAIVSSTAQDPHSFEPSARDQLAVQRADLIIENGVGYDAFVDALIDASGSTAPVITAAEFSHDWPDNPGHDEAANTEAADEPGEQNVHEHGEHEHVAGFNEHVWYDPHTIEHVAEAIADELIALLPAQSGAIEERAAAFAEGIGDLEVSLTAIGTASAGVDVFVTEPVALPLVQAASLHNVSPEAFTEAVEEGQDVAPATLLESLKLLRSGDVRAVIANSQTGGAETTEVIAEAESLSIPVIEFSETLPDGQTYLSWMKANIEALAGALQP